MVKFKNYKKVLFFATSAIFPKSAHLELVMRVCWLSPREIPPPQSSSPLQIQTSENRTMSTTTYGAKRLANCQPSPDLGRRSTWRILKSSTNSVSIYHIIFDWVHIKRAAWNHGMICLVRKKIRGRNFKTALWHAKRLGDGRARVRFLRNIFTLPLAKIISLLDEVCSSINIGRFNLFV